MFRDAVNGPHAHQQIDLARLKGLHEPSQRKEIAKAAFGPCFALLLEARNTCVRC